MRIWRRRRSGRGRIGFVHGWNMKEQKKKCCWSVEAGRHEKFVEPKDLFQRGYQ